uniref:Solute carrier family 35 member B3 n=1 Tax=Sus scrofa TaxID=9823 RepID=A0A8D0YAH8_PIG
MRAPAEEAAAVVDGAGVGEEEKQEDLAQQTKEKLNKGEETNKHHAGNTECGRIRTMDLKFNNSRKYVSITVPSKTQAMSPHIKSIDDIVVLGINLSRFNKLTQFFICVAGVFVFYLIYGYLQLCRSLISLWFLPMQNLSDVSTVCVRVTLCCGIVVRI